MASLDNEYRAIYRRVPMSARKIRPFADLIRGKNAGDALNLLECYPNRGAMFIKQVLASAVKNARDRNASNPDDLDVLEVFVDGGPSAKRFRPKSRGSSSVYLKRTSHITVIIG